VDPRAVLDAVVKRKIPRHRRESNPRIPIVQPVAQRVKLKPNFVIWTLYLASVYLNFKNCKTPLVPNDRIYCKREKNPK
jgi:hypothetical protein